MAIANIVVSHSYENRDTVDKLIEIVAGIVRNSSIDLIKVKTTSSQDGTYGWQWQEQSLWNLILE